jgi:hypothetical protein
MFFLYQESFLNEARLKFEENLYLHFVTESRDITKKVTVNYFLLYFACRNLLLSVQHLSAAIRELDL